MHLVQFSHALFVVLLFCVLFYGRCVGGLDRQEAHRKGHTMNDNFVWFSLDDYDALGFGAVVYANTDNDPLWCSASLLIVF